MLDNIAVFIQIQTRSPGVSVAFPLLLSKYVHQIQLDSGVLIANLWSFASSPVKCEDIIVHLQQTRAEAPV